jgi:NAD(P)-dependent dehydrogenase (short-subunit alcohol dehydrogenase family)
MPSIRLDDKVVVVTGSSRNLGKAMALGVADAGARVVLASPETDLLAEVAAEIDRKHGKGRAFPVTVDITNGEDVERLRAAVLDRFGAIHVLVNCARRSSRGPGLPADGNHFKFWESDPDIWRDTIRVGVNGTFTISRALVQPMMEQKWGRIVIINTSVGTMQRALNSPYGVSKAALEASALIWSRDLEGTGVTVNTLVPGGSCDVGPHRYYPPGKKLLPVTVMNNALIWLASDRSTGSTGGRYVGKLWDDTLPPDQAAERCREAAAIRLP